MRKGIRGLLAVAGALGCVLCASAPAAQAALSVPSQTFTALAPFEAQAGGADNGTTAGEQGSGFRHFTPAGIAVNGSDPGSTAIPGGHTAALSRSRLQPWGIELGPEVAVADDGFQSVNSNAGFNPPDLWAPFNSNTTQFQVVAPATPTPAATRGLGIEFVHVENSGTTIQYYSGNGLIGQLSAPQGATSFAGMLFRDPVVTRVVITLGTAEVFGFDGTNVTTGGTNPSSLAAGDDVVLAEPGAGEATVAATAGVPIAPVLDSFDSGDSAREITATVDWGDGTASSGTVVPSGGGAFAVAGSHTYALPGSYTANVTVDDFSGAELVTQALVRVSPRTSATSLACSPGAVAVSAITTCTAVVSDDDAGNPVTPTGVVTFSSPSAGASFPAAGSCILGPTATPGSSLCIVQFEAGQLPPAHARVTGTYGGDRVHAASAVTATVDVHPQRCTLRVLAHRLRPQGLGVLVTCDARASVRIVARALVARKGRLRSFQIQFGTLSRSVTAGRPTVLVVKPAPGVLATLRGALHRHQHISLRLTLTASSHATTKTTTTRVSAVRLS